MAKVDNWQRVADAVAARRGELKMTVADLAAKADVSIDTITDVEKVRRPGKIRRATLARLASGLNWPPDALPAIASGAPIPRPVAPDGLEARIDEVEVRVSQLEAGLLELTQLVRRHLPGTRR